MRTISAILFDKDGTLFDYNKTWANWAKDLLIDLAEGDETLARRLGNACAFNFDLKTFEPESPLISDAPDEIATAMLPHLPSATKAGLVTRITSSSAGVVQAEATPLLPLFQELASRGLLLGLTTNDTVRESEDHLDQAGVRPLFEHVFGCDSGFAPKPSPDMLLAFCEKTGHDPEDVAMVGDSTHDMSAARDAGMLRVGVTTGVSSYNQLTAISDVVLPSIAGLPHWLDSYGSAETAA